jgi:hypothetical protein
MRSRRVMPIAILLCLTSVGGVDAFDGQRKGFVLGAGLGGGVYTFTQSLDMAKSDRVTEGVITTDVRIGGGLNDKFVLSGTRSPSRAGSSAWACSSIPIPR